jgi:penicillin-binding protein 1B
MLGAMVTGLVVVAVFVWQVDQEWSPLIEPRMRENNQRSSVRVLVDSVEGEPKWIGSFTAGRMEERQPLTLSDVPPLLIQAIVVLEDPRFLSHEGFDVLGIFRAFYQNLVSLRYAQGGSTITQQLVKNVFLTKEKTLKRKITELILSALLERRYSKDEILEAYINEVYLGQLGPVQIHGVGRAAEYYFSKPVQDLRLPEAALLAAIINSPGLYNPWRHPERAMQRRNRAIRSLLEANLILPEEAEEAEKSELPGPSTYAAKIRAAYLMNAVKAQIIEERSEAEVLNGNFDVRLSLDLALQERAEQILLEESKSWEPEQQAIMVGSDPRDCTIKMYIGGTDYRISQLDHIRQIQRPIGSLIKPLLLAPLLNNDPKLTLATSIDDAAFKWSYDKGRGTWSPQNYDKTFRGTVSVRDILEQSLNVPLVKIFHDREPSGILWNIFDPLRALGLQTPADRTLPSSLLGTIEQSPWSVLLAYTKFVRQATGLAKDPADLACRLSFEKPPELNLEAEASEKSDRDKPGFGQEGARLSIAALEGALRRGTSRSLGAEITETQEWAGKTGTSSDGRDSWYALMSPNLVMITWIGRDDNLETGLTGASGALQILRKTLRGSHVYSAEGWRWPQVPKMEWRVLRYPERCLVDQGIEEKIIKQFAAVYAQSTPPPVPFDFEKKKFIFELFRHEAIPENCPEAFKSK